MPGTPTSVTSCAARSDRLRRSASRTRSSSSRAADERRRRPLGDVDAEAGAGLERLPGGHGLRLSLGVDRRCRPVRDRPVGGAVGRLADEHAVDRRRRLQAGGGVHDVARGHPLAPGRVGAEDDERLARVHAHAHVEVERGVGLVHLGDRRPDGERRPHRPLGVVLVRDRCPEHRHHRVADELLHRAAEVLQPAPQDGVVGSERAAHVLDVHPLAAAGEADEVGEEHRDDLALLDRRDSASAAPQLPQKRKPSGFCWPQRGQIAIARV